MALFDCFDEDSDAEPEEDLEKLVPVAPPPPTPKPKATWPWKTLVPVLSIFFVLAIGVPVIATIFTQLAIKSTYDTKADRSDAVVDDALTRLVDYNRSVFNLTGPRGPRGPAGPKGAAGLTGAAVTGPQGPVGPKGPVGDNGTGLVGPQGLKGPKGDTGDQGNTTVGPQGIRGLNGTRGPPGAVGPRGETGDNGTQGINGTQGLKGETGDVTCDSSGNCTAYYTNDTWSFGVHAAQRYAVALGNATQYLTLGTSNQGWGLNASTTTAAAVHIRSDTLHLGPSWQWHANGTVTGLPLLLSGSSVAMGGVPTGSAPFRLMECQGGVRVSETVRGSAVSLTNQVTAPVCNVSGSVVASTTRLRGSTTAGPLQTSALLSTSHLNVSGRINTTHTRVTSVLSLGDLHLNGSVTATGHTASGSFSHPTAVTMGSVLLANGTISTATVYGTNVSLDASAGGDVYFKTGTLTVVNTTNVVSIPAPAYRLVRVQGVVQLHTRLAIQTSAPAVATYVTLRLPERHNATGPFGIITATCGTPIRFCFTDATMLGAASGEDMSVYTQCLSEFGTQTVRVDISVAYARY